MIKNRLIPRYETMSVWDRIALKARHGCNILDDEERDVLEGALFDSLIVAMKHASDEQLLQKAKEIGIIL